MKIAFLADIHGNLEALEACLESIGDRGIGKLVFLGDIVGYGADPAACIAIVRQARELGATVVIGNHDEAVLATRFRLNPTAATAVQWTTAVLSDADKAFLADLPLVETDGDRLYVHASAHTPELYPYIQDVQGGSESLRATSAAFTFCGHVHVPALYHISTTGKVMGFTPDPGMPIPLSSNRRWLAVMGSVGQPRDGNPTAAYGIFDDITRELTFVRVPYDIDAAAAKIRGAGLPDTLWKRLSVGR